MSALTSSNPDNANPTVHKTGREASARSRYRLADFLDDDEQEYSDDEGSRRATSMDADKDTRMQEDGLTYESAEGGSGSESEPDEPIDSQEIFGGSDMRLIARVKFKLMR